MWSLKYLLWLQTGYAIWQFFRYTKFVRLPYVVLSSVWNSGLAVSWFKKRTFLWIQSKPEFNTQRLECLEDMEKIKDTSGYYAYDGRTFFKIGKEAYTYEFDNFYLAALVTHYQDYPIGYKLLPIYKDIFILKCLSLEEALEKVAEGAEVHFKDEYCLLDETTEDYLNENFLRIMSILPLSLQAKSFEVLSIYLSSALLVLDLFSVPANKAWQWFSRIFIRYTKLTLAHFPVRIRVPIHYVLSTGSEEFMFRDMHHKKTYWTQPGDFLIKTENRTDGWMMKNTLRGEPELTVNNQKGKFTLAGQQVLYDIWKEDDGLYIVEFKTSLETIQVKNYWHGTVSGILYKISIIDNLPTPPVEKMRGNVIISFTSIET